MTDYILGIDIGGTNIKAGIFDLKNFKIIDKKHFKTENNLEKLLKIFSNIIKEFKKKYNFQKAGIGFPGNIDKSGKIIFSPNLKASLGFNIVEWFRDKLNISIKIDNDANVATLAHLKFSDNEFSDIICLTLGTGIGGGVVLNKKLLSSSRNIGFELGHINVKPDGELCSCGKKGCMEAYCSARGITKRYGNRKFKEFKDIYNLYKNGDKKAETIIKEGFFYLGIGTGNLINIFAPEIVYFAGGISEVFNEFFENFYKGIKSSTLDFLLDKVCFEKSNIKDAGILGAVSLWI